MKLYYILSLMYGTIIWQTIISIIDVYLPPDNNDYTYLPELLFTDNSRLTRCVM